MELQSLTQTDHFARAIAFARWPIFKIVSLLEYLGFFEAVFCTQLLSFKCWIDFRKFFLILNFDSNRPFCKGYSLGEMADFQNRLTGIFNFFWSGCCTELLSCNCRIDFCKFFGILNVDPNQPFCKGYSLCKIADFKNRLISGIFGIFRAVFFTDYSLCKMA